jgi:hypothetical protein
VESTVSRAIWRRLEAINAVTYFAPECRAAYTDLGLRGFWMGYFAGRAAPLGPVSADIVDATFFNFHPAMVRRAIPDAWTYASPAAIVTARASAAAAATRRLAPVVDAAGPALRPLLTRAIAHGDATGRPLFAANRAVARTSDETTDLWQAATTLREHRGDGHVLLLREAGLGGCEAHVLYAATESVDPSVLRDNRGWSTDDWDAASERLQQRGLLESPARPTRAGQQLRRHIELGTDDLAWQPYAALADEEIERILEYAARIAGTIAASGVIPFPNPIGLPLPARDE